jgi:Protein of unknown function, DUF481
MLLLPLLLTVAHAEDSTFAGASTAPVEVEEVETDLSAEVGAAYADGNVWYYTVNAGLSYGRKWGSNRVSGAASANLGRAAADLDGDGIVSDTERPGALFDLPESARKLAAEARYDRFLTERGSLYLLAGAYTDRFSGYDARSHEQIGYSLWVVQGDAVKLRTELGADYAQEFYVEGTDSASANIIAARVLVGLEWKLNENVSFTDTAETYVNVLSPDDTRVLNQAVLSSKLSTVFSVKLSHTLTFDNVPVTGYRPLDQGAMVTLVATLM